MLAKGIGFIACPEVEIREGPVNVAITLGQRGSLVAHRRGSYRHPGKVVDTVGAGDAFTARLVYAYRRGATLAKLSNIGNLCGSFVASQHGATPEFPEDLLGRIRGELRS